jgi:hypothetical protein
MPDGHEEVTPFSLPSVRSAANWGGYPISLRKRGIDDPSHRKEREDRPVPTDDVHRITHGVLVRGTLLAALALGTAACGGGGGGPAPPSPAPAPPPAPPPVTNNLKATGVQVLTPDPRIAYPLAVSVSITAAEATNNVGVSLFAIEKNDDPNVEIRQFPLGNETIARAEAGTRSYELAVNIPSSVELPGAYFIAAVVDPVEEVAETDEADNTASVETPIASEGQPNILLKSIELDRTVLDINTSTYAEQVTGEADNVYNADAGGTITVGADGLAVGETIELEGFATLRLSRSDLGTTHDVPLYLWSSDAARYMNAYGIDPSGVVLPAPEWLPLGEFAPQLVTNTGGEVGLDDLNRDSAHMNFYVPGRLGKTLETAMRYSTGPGVFTVPLPTVPPPDLTAAAIDSLKAFLRNLPSNGVFGDETAAMAVMEFEICVKIRPADPALADRSLDDNELCSPLSILLPPIVPPPVPGAPPGFTPHFSKPSNALRSAAGFATKGGGSAFGFAVDFGGSASADYRGYVEEVHARVPVTVFGVGFDYMRLEVRAQLVPDYAGKPADEESGFTLEMRHLGQMLTSVDLPATSSPALTVSFSKEAPDPEKPYEAFIGPIPVIGGASVAGNLGVEYEVTFTADATDGYAIGPSLSPFINVEASVFAGVGNRLFSAGVEGVLTLLDERLTLFGGTEIDVLDAGFQSGIAEFVIVQGFKITNVFTGPRGAINLYARYSVPGFKTCSWGFIKGICPTILTLKATKNIWRSKALFQLRDVLLHIPSEQLDVVVAQGEDPAYYVP